MKKTLLLFAFLSALLVLPVAEGQKKRAKRDSHALSLQQARSRARLLHDVLSDTLDVIHRDYFGDGGGRKVVPSKALESVFYRQRRKWKVKAKWLAVNADAMHVDHKPKDAFEKRAVRALSRGKREYEEFSAGRYRRAAEIPLFESCLKCHLVLRSNNKRRRVAALVISLPAK